MRSEEKRDPGFLGSLKDLSLWKTIVSLTLWVIRDPTRLWRDIRQLTSSAVLLGMVFFVLLSFLASLPMAWHSAQGELAPEIPVVFLPRFLLGATLLRALLLASFWILLANFVSMFSAAFDIDMSREQGRKIAFGAIIPLAIATALCEILFLNRALALLIMLGSNAYAIYIMKEGLSEFFAVSRKKSIAHALLSFGSAAGVFLVVGGFMMLLIFLSLSPGA